MFSKKYNFREEEWACGCERVEIVVVVECFVFSDSKKM